jgi:hypothetical protein
MRFRNIPAGGHSIVHGAFICWLVRPGAFRAVIATEANRFLSNIRKTEALAKHIRSAMIWIVWGFIILAALIRCR